MGSEDTPGQEDGSGEDDATERGGPLVSMYRRYIGEPESRQVVYAGFGLFFAGVALGVAALVLFLLSGAQTTESDSWWQLREAALVFVMLALPAVALSVSVLLPVGRRTTAASLGGVAICLVATGWLTQVYPYDWTTAGNDVLVLSGYAVGVVVLAASTGSALVAQYLDRVGPGEVTRVTEVEIDGPPRDDGESVSDEEVAADIEEAMSDSTLTWGGVEQQSNTKRLNLDMPDTDADLDDQNIEPATETRSSGESVDNAVDGLRQLQGEEEETARAQSPDDQVDALTAFRDQQAEDELETGVEADRGRLKRLREKLFR